MVCPSVCRKERSGAEQSGAAMAAMRLAGISARPLGAAEPLALGSLQGKVLLVVNVASL